MPGTPPDLRDSISEQLYNDLLTGIQVGDYPSLAPLPTEATLAHDYGVSRTIVRSALSVLKKEGVIVSRQGSGTIVARNGPSKLPNSKPVVSPEDIKKCYQCREAMEPYIAALAAKNRQARDIRYLKGQLRTFRQESEAGVIDTGNDTEFHMQLVNMAQNQFFESAMMGLRPHILIGMNITKTLSEKDRKSHERSSLSEHRMIANAVISGDCDAAKQAMYRHINGCQKRIFGALEG